MRLEFGKADAGGVIPGKRYLCLPDERTVGLREALLWCFGELGQADRKKMDAGCPFDVPSHDRKKGKVSLFPLRKIM